MAKFKQVLFEQVFLDASDQAFVGRAIADGDAKNPPRDRQVGFMARMCGGCLRKGRPENRAKTVKIVLVTGQKQCKDADM
jgi:hypothetical protein